MIRNGVQFTVSTEELCVGDIAIISQGMTVPADCVLVAGTGISCDEGALTGEPDELKKFNVTESNFEHNPNPFLLRSTLCVSGDGKAVVVAVGERTLSGRADAILNVEAELTPLQKKLETIANQIGKMGVFVAVLTFIAMVCRMLFDLFLFNPGQADVSGTIINQVLNAFIIAVTVIVVAVPEGLPLAVTISLAFSVSKMYDQHNLVRKLHASETMGGANEICTDKTGTLTQNRMTVQAIHHEDAITHGSEFPGLPARTNADVLAQCVLWNCSAFVETEQDGSKVCKGNVTEVGLLNYLLRSQVDVEDYLARKAGAIEMQIPFDSKRKRQTTAVRTPEGVRVFVKGAPEIVIQRCVSFLDAEGAAQELDEEKVAGIVGEEVVKRFARKCYRTLLVAYVDLSEEEWAALKEQSNNFESPEAVDTDALESGLTLVAIFGLVDPLRPGIQAAVQQCHSSGITVRMCTGDNIDTATAISKEAGIISEEDLAGDEAGLLCMTGMTFRTTVGGLRSEKTEEGAQRDRVGNMAAFRRVAKKLRVLARSSPEDKYLLVTGLRDCGSVVAVTGDGTNDAPALNKADVGFAMGITGTDVAKNASDIILMDDNFCSVLTAVEYGRNIFDSVRKFLQFQITVNVVAMFIVFAGAVIFSEPPLNSVQMLWVNLIMDTFAALALATEPPSKALLDRQPASKFDKIVNSTMWRNIFGQGFYQIAVLLLLLFCGKDWFGFAYSEDTPLVTTQAWVDANPAAGYAPNQMTQKAHMYTIVFQAFVFMQLFNQINARKLGDRDFNVFAGFFNNWLFLLITLLTFAVQVCMVQFAGRFATVIPLSLEQNAWCLLIGAGSLLWGLLIKLILPPSLFNCLAMPEHPMTDQEADSSMLASMRKSYRKSTAASDQTPWYQARLAAQPAWYAAKVATADQ